MKKFLLYLVIGLGYAHAQPSPYTNAKFPPTVIAASGITSAPIDLATYGSSVGNSFATGTVTLTGSSLTTATFGVLGSSDGGVTYFPVNISTVTAPGTVATTATATANGLYYVNLAGLDHIEFVTSGTFTATSISLKLSATPNGLISRTSGGGSSAGALNTVQVAAAAGAFGAATGVSYFSNGTAGANSNGFQIQATGSPIPAFLLSILGIQGAFTGNAFYNGTNWVTAVSGPSTAIRNISSGAIGAIQLSACPTATAGTVLGFDVGCMAQWSEYNAGGPRTWFNSQAATPAFPTNAALVINPAANWWVDYSGNERAASVKTATFTVATLPSAATLGAGAQVVVSDATTFTVGTCTGGGANFMIAVSSGTAWSCH